MVDIVFANNFCPTEEANRRGNYLNSETKEINGDLAFCFLGRGFSVFQISWKQVET